MEVVKFPGWRFGPDGQEQIFDRAEDVPEGWTDNPRDFDPKPKAVEEPKGEVVVSKYDGWDKTAMIEELEKRSVTFNKNWPEKKLIGLLEAADKDA